MPLMQRWITRFWCALPQKNSEVSAPGCLVVLMPEAVLRRRVGVAQRSITDESASARRAAAMLWR